MSTALVVAGSLVSTLVAGFIATAIAFVSLVPFNDFGDPLYFGEGEVLVTDNADAEMATALGDYLLKIGYFDHETRKSVQLDKKKDQYIVRMVVNEIGWTDPGYLGIFNRGKNEMETEVFKDEQIVMELCDTNLEMKVVIEGFGKLQLFEQCEVFVKPNADPELATKLGDYLMEIGYFDANSAKSVQLDKIKDRIVVRMVVNDEAIEGTTYDEAFEELQDDLEENVFDQEAIRMELCDTNLKTQKVLSDIR